MTLGEFGCEEVGRTVHQRVCVCDPKRIALRTILAYSPLVEIGAGTGYWARLLRQLGADIVCYDAVPPAATTAEQALAMQLEEGAGGYKPYTLRRGRNVAASCLRGSSRIDNLDDGRNRRTSWALS